MNFSATEAQRLLSDGIERFIRERFAFDPRHRGAERAGELDREKWRALADLGVLAALFSERDGGLGGGSADLAIVFEALGRGLVVEPVLGSAVLAGTCIADAASAAQRRALPGLIDGTTIAALAHEEPGGHYELTRVETRATRSDEGWRLEGTKSCVAYGAAADLAVVSARVAGAADAADGIALFIIPVANAGLTVHSAPTIDGAGEAEFALDGVLAATDAVLGVAGGAYPVLERAIGRGILALCAEALGAMEFLKSATLQHLQTRRQFGVPIGSFQALQHRMADLLLDIEQARSAVINAVAAFDGERRARERALSAAKFTIGRVGSRVAEESIQLHGGMGLTWALPAAHYAKRLVMIDHQLGDEDHHLQRFIEFNPPPP